MDLNSDAPYPKRHSTCRRLCPIESRRCLQVTVWHPTPTTNSRDKRAFPHKSPFMFDVKLAAWFRPTLQARLPVGGIERCLLTKYGTTHCRLARCSPFANSPIVGLRCSLYNTLGLWPRIIGDEISRSIRAWAVGPRKVFPVRGMNDHARCWTKTTSPVQQNQDGASL